MKDRKQLGKQMLNEKTSGCGVKSSKPRIGIYRKEEMEATLRDARADLESMASLPPAALKHALAVIHRLASLPPEQEKGLDTLIARMELKYSGRWHGRHNEWKRELREGLEAIGVTQEEARLHLAYQQASGVCYPDMDTWIIMIGNIDIIERPLPFMQPLSMPKEQGIDYAERLFMPPQRVEDHAMYGYILSKPASGREVHEKPDSGEEENELTPEQKRGLDELSQMPQANWKEGLKALGVTLKQAVRYIFEKWPSGFQK